MNHELDYMELKHGLSLLLKLAEIYEWQGFSQDRVAHMQAIAAKLHAEAKAERDAAYLAALDKMLASSADVKAVAA